LGEERIILCYYALEEKNYEIICHIKTTIVLWKTLELNYAFAMGKKFSLIFIWKKK